jgi:hypothetical protein
MVKAMTIRQVVFHPKGSAGPWHLEPIFVDFETLDFRIERSCGQPDLAEYPAIDKAYPRSSHSRFPSTPGVSRAMPADDLLDQFFAEPSGKRARAQ